MAASNHERVGKGLELLRKGLMPFVQREMESIFQEDWEAKSLEGFRDDGGKVKKGKVQWDAHLLLSTMWNNWNNVFKRTLGHSERSIVSELREVRNRWAHQESFTTDDTYRAFDSMHRLLQAVSAEEADDIDRMRQELLRVRYEEQAKREVKKVTVAPLEGKPASSLKPWRELVTPHPDVASGNYQQAEFAADLAQVHRGGGSSEYKDPVEFYRRTYLTDGLRHLLKNALLRLSSKGGDPVIELQTNFGGGKTHSLLALYHLLSGKTASEIPGLDSILEEAGIESIPQSRRAVFVGTAFSPAKVYEKKDGTQVRTLWGELAWQLGDADGKGKEAYGIIGESDAAGTSPGTNELIELLKEFSPCLILIDEWVAYARQLFGVSGLPAGSFDSHFTFSQALSEAVKAVPSAHLVVSIPSSDIELGGEAGKEALTRLKNSIGRVESAWRPASAEEGFEIVRRRLFQPIGEPEVLKEIDTVVTAYSQYYQQNASEFPSEVREREYERRMKSAYPIHPELFERLYKDWGSLDKFQLTRGVLRLMAAVIHLLWKRDDKSLLISPATIPMDANTVQFELMRYLEDQWGPVLARDVDGPDCTPRKIDGEVGNLGRYSACRRVARTIYLGSAPTIHTAQRGIDDRHIKLGCAQPGESVATFGDALRRLTDKSMHMYVDGNRYWYSLQQSVTRLAIDRSAQQEQHIVSDEIKRRLRDLKRRGDFVRVHPFPETSAEVPDEAEARLVILGPEHPHSSKTPGSDAGKAATELLERRGNSPRIYRNMLIFLAPDKTRLSDLDQAVRNYLAWDSIASESEQLNLDAFQSRQAQTKCKEAYETVERRIQESYIWSLVPSQDDPHGKVELQESRVPQGDDTLPERISCRLKNDGLLITQYSATALRIELDGKNLWKEIDHLSIKKLWEYFATYPYLPRLQNAEVLIKAIQDGVADLSWTDNFAYAEAYDEEKKKYLSLRAGYHGSVILDDRSVIIKPGVADKQLTSESKDGEEKAGYGGEEGGEEAVTPPPAEDEEAAVSQRPKRFYGSYKFKDPTRVSDEIGTLSQEVIQHLTSIYGSKVEITLEVHADIPDGVDEKVERDVSENCSTLKFKDYGFEKE